MLTKKSLSLSFVTGLISLAVGCSNNSFSNNAKCPSHLADYPSGVATPELVKTCMGNPTDEDHDSGGKFVYGYVLPDNTTAKFFFDKNNKLIKARKYESNL